MLPSAGDELAVKPSGLVLAGVTFLLTRVVVAGTVFGAEMSPWMATLRFVPLVLGLALVVYGVSLAVSTHDRAYVNSVARWSVFGTAGMLVLLAIAVVDPADPTATMADLESSVVVATGLIGGAAGGALLGRREATIERQRRRLDRQGDQAVLLNRLLRHEVLNALTAIRGHAELLVEGDDTERSLLAVRNNTERVARTVDDIGFLVRAASDDVALEAVSLDVMLREAADQIESTTHGASVSLPSVEDLTVRADEHLSTVFAELFHYAVNGRVARTGRRAVHPQPFLEDGGSEAEVTVEATEGTVRVRVSGPGLALGPTEREALLTGLPEFDAPEAGYGVSVVRLLVDGYGGALSYTAAPPAVTVELPRTAATAVVRRSDQHGVAGRTLWWVTGAALAAGVAMGALFEVASGGIAIIGALYGVFTPAVGWVTHLFHSVVFGLLFAAALSHHRLARLAGGPLTCAVVGAAYGVGLWLVAAGVVMGVWLNLVGIAAPVPNLNPLGLAAHVLWGVVLGSLVGLREVWG
jgi:two-component system OmpR family sensor kinase